MHAKDPYESLIDIRNSVNNKEIPKNENPNKITDVAEKIFNFNKQQKDRGLKILTLKQMIERLPIALAQVEASKTSENLLNEIHQIIHSLYRAKEVTKKKMTI